MNSEDELQKIRIHTREQLGAIPRVLRELQELVPLLSVAYSTDGRTFGYEAPLSMSIPLGSYVALSSQDGREYFGQIITKEVSIRQGAEIGLELGSWPECFASGGSKPLAQSHLSSPAAICSWRPSVRARSMPTSCLSVTTWC
jgi:hypothetical protein